MPSVFSPSNMTTNSLPTPYVASASQTRAGYNPYFAFATAPTDPWYSDVTASATTPGYLELDTGSGNAWVLTSYDVSARGFTTNQASEWLVQGSNDELRWTTLDSQTGQTPWTSSQTRTFTVTTTDAFRYYRLYITNNSGGAGVAVGFLALTGTAGAATPEDPDFAPHNMTSDVLPTPYVSSASSVAPTGPYPAWFAFDGSVTNQWAGTGAGVDWLQLYLGAGVYRAISGYAVRGGFQGFPLRAPKDWTLQVSYDGIAWMTINTQTNQTDWQVTWGAGVGNNPEVRSFPISPVVVAGYPYFRLDITANNGDVAVTAVFELYLFGVGAAPVGTSNSPMIYILQ